MGLGFLKKLLLVNWQLVEVLVLEVDLALEWEECKHITSCWNSDLPFLSMLHIYLLKLGRMAIRKIISL